MKYVHVTNTPDMERVPDIINLLAGSAFVDESRLYDWNTSRDSGPTVLFEVFGDAEQFEEALTGIAGVQWFDMTRVTETRFNLLALLETDQIPLLKKVLRTLTRERLIVAKPVIYRDEKVRARIVGNASVLQSAVMDLPPEMDVEIDRIGDFDTSRESPVSTLTDRQREALVEAFDLGYYEHPRQATHEDVAARLGCAAHTASEHLQKAEMKVLTEVLRLEFER